MKALVCESFDGLSGVQYRDLPDPKPQEGEVLIKVNYCGVNFPDTLIIQGKYQFRPELPFVPGGEVAGEVLEVGTNVKKLNRGQRVLAAMGWGAFGEKVVVQEANVYKIPEGVPSEQAAALLETFATAFHALKDRAELSVGETLVVLGAAGGTGIATIQIGKQFGAKVVACVSSEEKARFCKAQGADEVINYEEENLKERLKDMGGANVIFDPVGGNQSELAFRSLLPGGRHLVVGFASGEIPAIPWNLPLLKSASVVGVFWGHFWRNEPKKNARNTRILLKWLEAGAITPVISQMYPLADGKNALQDLMERKAKGKIVLKV
ncbi:NADPH:quinone oxidoreductase family protein [Marinoscillum sp. MHG1-6]|uniref:NADPH:quinone oxidoreductase family protein n=1 Tax=Marinoscillum sp. MHG1-6 TaxID=2959627 RepID=UPI00215762B5|nr:NADPH:quinone oxidoreductase family protein [Marinoscillum sp. MHG1-6]